MAKKKVQAVSFDDLKKLVVNEAKNNNNVLTQEQIDEYLMNYDLSDELAEELFANGQVAMQYTDLDGQTTMNGLYNINGSSFAIEGITSADGKIFGKMGHSERYEEGLFQNISGNKHQDIFTNGVNYFKK